jgi:WD40 repeat protein/serine/threonine protein kinase
MTPHVQRKVEDVFAAVMAARERDAPAQGNDGAADLTGLCGGDERVRREVVSLLSHLDAAGPPDEHGHFLDPRELHGTRIAPGRDDDALLREWGGEAVGQRVGGFTIIGRLGEGGMGVVYVAEQQRPRRTVALKLIRRSSATRAVLRRFEREALLLGRLNHPGIAQVFEAGIAEIEAARGDPVQTPYIAMELVDGPNILRFARERDTSIASTLDLIAQACDAIQHSHHRGVIHRDLKPANILVTGDEPPRVKVVDFGVARMVDKPGAESVGQFTEEMHLVGTLSYMSPEQFGSRAEIDTRCDVYALGAVLYQMLAGRVPVDVAHCALPEAARRVLSEEPVRLGQIDRALRGDLETIVAKALEKDPARRYQSAAELGRDVRHYLAGEPIEAKRDSLLYMMRKQATRYRNLSLLMSLFAIITVAFAAYVHRQERKEALLRSEAESARILAADSASRLAAELSASSIEQGRLLGESGDIAMAERFLWDETLAHPESVRARWALWELYSRNGCRSTVVAHQGESLAVCTDVNGGGFASGGTDGFVRLWSLPDAHLFQEIRTGLGEIHSITFAPDRAWLGAAGVGGAEIYELPSGRKRCTLALPPAGRVSAITAAPHGRFLATLGADGVIRLWNDRGALLKAIVPDPSDVLGAGQALSFSPNGRRMVAGFSRGAVRVWELVGNGNDNDVRPGVSIAGHGAAVDTVSFSPDGTLVASGSMDRNLALWDATTGAAVGIIETRNGTAYSAAFNPDGTRIAVMGYWRAQIFDVGSRQRWDPPGVNALGAGGGYDVTYSRGGRYLISTGPSGMVRIWDLKGAVESRLQSIANSPVRALALGRRRGEMVMAALHDDGTLVLRSRDVAMVSTPFASDSVGSWTQRTVVRGTPGQAMAMSPDTSQVVIGRRDGRISIIARDTGQLVQELNVHRAAVTALCFTPDGLTFCSGSDDASIRFWRRAGEGASTEWLAGPVARVGVNVVGAAASSDGTTVVTTQRRTSVAAWSVQDGSPLGTIAADAWRPAISPDGRICVGLWDWSVQLWDAHSYAAPPPPAPAGPPGTTTRLVGHTQLVTEEAFDPTGRLLVTVSDDGKVKLWDVAPTATATAHTVVEPRRCLATLDARAGEANALAFLPPPLQHQIAVGYRDGSVQIWDLRRFDAYVAGQVEFQRSLRKLSALAR